MRPRNGVFTDCPSKERTVIHPLGLNELKLPAQIGSDGREHKSPVHAIIVQDTVGQLRTVASSAPDHSVDARDTRYVGVARVHPVQGGDPKANPTGTCLRAVPSDQTQKWLTLAPLPGETFCFAL